MKTNERSRVVTEIAVYYLLLLGFALTVTGAMAWFFWRFMACWLR